MIILNETLYTAYSKEQKVLNESVALGTLLLTVVKSIAAAIGGFLFGSLLFVASMALIVLILVGVCKLEDKEIEKKINNNPALKQALIKSVKDCQSYLKKNIKLYKNDIEWKEINDFTSKNIFAKVGSGDNKYYMLEFKIAEYNAEQLFKDMYGMTPSQYRVEKDWSDSDSEPPVPKKVKAELRKMEDEISSLNTQMSSTKLGKVCTAAIEYETDMANETYAMSNFMDYDSESSISLKISIMIKSFDQTSLDEETKENIKKIKESLK